MSQQPKSKKNTLTKRLKTPIVRLQDLRKRRAHKSFAMTKQRDIPKRPTLPRYLPFTRSVFDLLWKYRRTFGLFAVLYILASGLLIGFSQQDQYRNLAGAVQDAAPDLAADGIGVIGQTVSLFGATISGTLNASLTEIQQLYLAILYLVTWLVLVWLMRQLYVNNDIKIREALYNACAPFISTLLIVGLMLLQAIPGAIGIFVFSIATQNGILAGGVEAMLFGIAALLLVTLSLYWLTSSFFALLIVTLPGTYPMVAIRGANDLALGRRLQLMVRLLWLIVLLAVVWVFCLFPALIIDQLINISWFPLVTIAFQVATVLSFVIAVSYIYMLYRRMIDEPTQ